MREPLLYYIKELGSLGVDTKDNTNELKDKQDNSNLVEAIKQTFMEEYNQTYDQWLFLSI